MTQIDSLLRLGNHKNIFQDAGIEVAEYRYWNSSGNDLDFAGMTADINVHYCFIMHHSCFISNL